MAVNPIALGRNFVAAVRSRGGLRGCLTLARRKLRGGLSFGQLLRLCMDKSLAPPPVLAVAHGAPLSYEEWQNKFEKMSAAERERAARAVKAMSAPPLISILMPVYNPRPEFLCKAIDSVKKQFYPHWQLCIADDASTDAKVLKILTGEADERIKIVFRSQNGNICAASNSALELCDGDYIALMDHDDLLPEMALYFVAMEIERHPEAQIIYSDEDKVDTEDRRFNPTFKGEWNEPLMLAQNYVNHLCVYKSELLKSTRFREGYEGGQDHDVLLRAAMQLKPGQIRHIPRVLYHWRLHEGLTTFSSEKRYKCELSRRALVRDWLAAKGKKATVSRGKAGFNNISYVPDAWPLVSCIVPARNHAALTRRCLEGLLHETDYPSLEIILVDNGSDEHEAIRLARECEEHGRIRVIHWDRPFNYSEINNMAAREATGQILALLNNDLSVIHADWLKQLVGYAIQPEVGAVGPMLLYENDTIQHGGIVRGLGGVAAHFGVHEPAESGLSNWQLHLSRWAMGVTGACLLLGRDKFFEVGGLDEKNLKVDFNDVDLCFRLHERGYKNVYVGSARLYHLESPSRKSDELPENRARFAREVSFMREKWQNLLLYDPYYSPWLSRSTTMPILLTHNETPYFRESRRL